MEEKKAAIENRFTSRILLPCSLVLLYSYVFSSIFTYINVLSASLLDADAQLMLYRLDLLPFAAGLLLFGLKETLRPWEKLLRSRIAGIFTLLCLPLTVTLFYTHDPALFYVTAMILPLFIGLLGGYVHLEFMGFFVSGRHFGLLYGIGTGLSILLQYLFQNVLDSQALRVYSILLALFLLAALENVSPPSIQPGMNEISGEDTEEHINSGSKTASGFGPKTKRWFLTLLLSTLVISVLLELIGNFLTSSLLLLVADNDYLTYSWPRLFIIFAYLAAGFIADRKKMRYLPAFTLCVIFIAILNPILFHSGKGMFLNTCIFYLMAGAVNSYLTLRFIYLASENPRFSPLICGAGRAVDSIFTCLLASPLLYALTLEAVIFIELFAIIIVVLILSFTGQLSFTDPPESSNPAMRISPEEFARIYGFTDKETDIFCAMLSHSGTVSDLAKTLYLSRSILYRYQHNICEKTGCSTFSDVKKLYYEMPGNPLPERIADKASAIMIEDAPVSSDPEEIETGPADPMDDFCQTYHLSEGERETLSLFLQNPGMSQAQLAEMRGVTLRTMQRHLGSIRQKSGVTSLPELTTLYLTFRSASR